MVVIMVVVLSDEALQRLGYLGHELHGDGDAVAFPLVAVPGQHDIVGVSPVQIEREVSHPDLVLYGRVVHSVLLDLLAVLLGQRRGRYGHVVKGGEHVNDVGLLERVNLPVKGGVSLIGHGFRLSVIEVLGIDEDGLKVLL